MKTYIVYRRKTGQRVAGGTSEQCAASLGMTYGSFLTMACRAQKGLTPYDIVVIDDTSGAQRKAAAEWDAAIYFPYVLRTQSPYPCTDCAHRSLCGVMDTRCRLWEQWYAAAYTIAARQLEQAAERQIQEGSSHDPG